jgi:hypothetical protein
MNRFCVVAALLLFAGQVAFAQPEEGEFYKIKNENSGLLLAVADESDKTGAKIIQAEPRKGDEAQQWKLVKVGEHYKLVNRKSGKALEVPDASKDEGVQIQQGEDKARSKGQIWTIDKVTGKFYAIKAQCSGLVLDVKEADKNAGAAVIQWPLNDKGDRKNQKWEFLTVK